MMSKEIIKHVQSIANDISDNGAMYCQECNHNFDSELEACPECGSEDICQVDAHWYLSDVLDIEYTVNGSGEYLGARILVSFGGPNIWINTRNNTVEGYWWSDQHFESFTDALGLDDYCNELWQCR